MKPLREIRGVEVFAAGTWNGDTYDVADLDKMVQAFDATKNLFKPYLKLGHNEDQQLIQADGMPAAGWIGSLYRMGEKLMADFVDIPQKIFELIENKAYRKVSSEIYWNTVVNDKKYPYLLGAVALLGADTPAVTKLNDILSMYGLKEYDQIKVHTDSEISSIIKQYSFKPDVAEAISMKTEAELKLELELKTAREQNEKLAADVKTYAKSQEDSNTELKALREAAAAADKKAADAILNAAQVRLEAYVSTLVSDRVITPAMKPYALALLGEDKKEYSIKVKGKDQEEDKTYSKEELLKQMLKLHTAKAVNTEEVSLDIEVENVSSDDAIDEKIKEYMKANECSYKAAYRAVASEHKPRASRPMGVMVEAQ